MNRDYKIKSERILAPAMVIVIALSFAVILPLSNVSAQPALDTTNKIKAKNIEIAITAKVATVQDFGNLLNGAIKVGDIITGKYVYNVKTPDSNSDPTVGDYRHTTSQFGIAVKAGGLVFRTDPGNVNFLVEIVNRDIDNYLLRSYNNLPLSDGLLVNHISWQLDDDSAKALSSDSLKKAPAPPILSAWNPPERSFGLTIVGGQNPDFDDYFIRAHVISAKLIK